MNIVRRFTQAGQSPFDQVEYTMRSSVLRNTDERMVYSTWSNGLCPAWVKRRTIFMSVPLKKKVFFEVNMLLSDWGNPESKLAEKTRITKWILYVIK